MPEFNVDRETIKRSICKETLRYLRMAAQSQIDMERASTPYARAGEKEVRNLFLDAALGHEVSCRPYYGVDVEAQEIEPLAKWLGGIMSSCLNVTITDDGITDSESGVAQELGFFIRAVRDMPAPNDEQARRAENWRNN